MEAENMVGYISRLQFNNGESLDVKQDDVVVFVGPNNAGKSQSLKDIIRCQRRKCQQLLCPIL